jgi:carbon storage regulator CsrA
MGGFSSRKNEMPSLILTRKLNEWVDIAEGEIKVKVVRVSGGQVKLMFTADKDIPIMRGELVEKNDASRAKQAAGDANRSEAGLVQRTQKTDPICGVVVG